MTIRPTNSRGSEPHTPPDAVNPYATTNPTVVLPAGRQGPGDGWPGRPISDVAEHGASPLPHHTATEDLWATSAASAGDQADWAREANQQSDFLTFEPLVTTVITDPAQSQPPLQNQSRPALTPPASPATSANGWGARAATAAAFDDPLRPVLAPVRAAVERALLESGEVAPLERTPERVELVRRLGLAALRRDPQLAATIPDAGEAERLLAALVDDVLGYGPLDALLRDETVTEILVTGPHMTYVEQHGRLHEVPVHFDDDAHLLRVIGRILRPLGITVSPASPIADVRLPDGTRVNVVVPPSALSGPTLTIRRAARRVYTLEQLVRLDTLSLHMADFLRLCVGARLNIVLSGGPGAGKTTLLNALAATIDERERIVLLEDAPELQLHQRHVVPLETRPARTDGLGSGATTARDLVRNAMRMRPERLILSECRGPETFDLIQALNAGVDGTLTAIYATSPRDALARLEAQAAGAGVVLAPGALRPAIATGVDLIVHVARLRDGTRRVTQITDVVGMEGEAIATADLFAFREAGVDASTGRLRGEFAATGFRPTFAHRLEGSPAPIFGAAPFARGA